MYAQYHHRFHYKILARIEFMKKTVLLVGDSIRLSYCQAVKALLSDFADVYYSDSNNQWTGFAMWNLPTIVEQTGVEYFDCIHWNTGIWDLHRHMVDGNFTHYDDYITINERLYKQMAHYGRHLIWATITPGGKQLDEQRRIFDMNGTGLYFLTDYRDKWNADVIKYNAGASEMYRSHGVLINDICSPILADTDRFLCDDGIHLSFDGIALVAKMVSDIIYKTLADDS